MFYNVSHYFYVLKHKEKQKRQMYIYIIRELYAI